ncbi:MAG TPA: ATP-binding protein [Bacteroidia bacterium]|jgi:NtrC-family two-component system sensor histidine kinase KinB|nr:ATP-binding protein [Bacteroidia bacterium]
MMQIKIKTKLSLGLGFLFVVIILIGTVGATYIHTIAEESKKILKDNYESVEYSKLMLQELDGISTDSSTVFKKIESNLKLQESNVTEIGEKEYTEEVRTAFNNIRRKGQDSISVLKLRNALYKITDLNMQAILRKNNQAQATADKVLVYIGIIGGICFLVVFTFIINFPGYIANPIKELTESIKQISNKNYNQRLHFRSNDEFGELAEAFNTMAEKLEHYENSNLAKIMFEKKRIETIINNMKDAIIGLNEKKLILFANMQAVQLLNLKEDEMIGKYAPDVALRNDLLRLLLNNANASKPLKIISSNKECYFTKENISISTDEKPIGEVILLKNITQFKELDLAKTNFIATVSHEFKTPISSIKMSLQILEEEHAGKINEEQKHLLDSIKDDANRLLKITGELLNMTQVESGNIQLSMIPTEPKEIIQYAINANKVLADQKKIKLNVLCPEETPKVLADSEKTTWVFTNLISNAIRYSDDNSAVQINITLKEGHVSFSVKDTGQGIPSQYKDKIFDRYFRVPGTKKEGTGLGLAISKEFIEAQGGKIELETNLGSGSEFIVTLNKAG